jgi:hypothetical protein
VNALPALTTQWTLDGVSFNTGADARGFSYLVKNAKGWAGSPPARPDLNNRPAGAGAYRASNYDGPRVIELDGIAQCNSRADLELLEDTIAGLCRAPNVLYPLVKKEYGRTLTLNVERNAANDVIPMPDGVTVSFNLFLVAPEPRKFTTTKQGASAGIAQGASLGIAWNGAAGTTGPEWDGPALPITGTVWEASSGVSGTMAMTNAGTANTPILFTITAPSTGTLPLPTITDTNRGNMITYGGTMVPGDRMTIDTATGLCLLNGQSVGGLFSRADFFEIPARGSLNVQFSAGGPADTATLTASWSNAY